MTVRRLAARASLDDPGPAFARAKAAAIAGDESWEAWLSEYERGDAVIVRLEVTLDTDPGSNHRVATVSRGLWVERCVHQAEFEQHVAELAASAFAVLTDRLVDLGHRLDRDELAQMYVHVELDDKLRKALSAPTFAMDEAERRPPLH